MVGCLYKVLAKVLANRLKKVLPTIIGDAQAAFVGGRQILDGVLIANEVIDFWKKDNSGGLILKIDFEKAYDNVNWNFLLDIMHKFGFGERWCLWIKECISTTSLSFFINGAPTAKIFPQKGLRQGDPISPFLFNIVVEVLNILMENATEEGYIRGIKVGREGVIISHLQFADDTIFFCNNDLEEILNIKRLLRWFQHMSGLKINFEKSMLCGVKVQDQTVQDLANILGCKEGKLPMKYLGLPLGANPNRLQTWQLVIDAVKKKLKPWKRRHISIGGRCTLIKSTLGNLPVYYMSIFRMPVAIANIIEKIQRQFLWGDSEEKRKLHLVKWDKVTKNKKFGGLGVKRLLEHNSALLAKWWWRFNKEKEALWVKVVLRKYALEDNTWLPKIPNRGKPSKIWKDMCSVGDYYADMGECIIQGFKFKVNSGTRIKFWRHKWLGEETLESTFPRLFRASTQQDAWVADVIGNQEQGQWNLLFRRRLHDWELEQLQILKQLLSSVQLEESSEDCLQWRWSKDLNFSVKSAYSKWEEDQKFVINEELASVWKNICPPKVEFFVWLAIQNCIAAKSVLNGRGILNINNAYCPFCNSEVETPEHVLVQCHISWGVWSAIVSW